MYYHGEPIPVTITVTNSTEKTVKKIKVTGKFLLLFRILLGIQDSLVGGLKELEFSACNYLSRQHGVRQEFV